MLLVATLALAAPIDIPELARRGAPLVVSCASAAPIHRLIRGGPLEALVGRVGALEGPMSLAMWDKDHLEIRLSSGGEGLGLPMRDEGGVHVFGQGIVGAEPIVVDKSLAVVLQTQPGCSVWGDVGRLPTGAGEAPAQGQVMLMLPDQAGPAQFAMASSEWVGKPRPAAHLELDLASTSAPFALFVSDSVVDTRPKDPKRRKQQRQLKALFPMDGFVVGVWMPEAGSTLRYAGSVSLGKDLSAAVITKRLGLALDHGKVPYSREGDLIHFRVSDVPALKEILDKSPEAGRAATSMFRGVEVWVQPREGSFRVASSRDALMALGTGQPMVSAELRTRLEKDDVILTVQPVAAFSSTDQPILMTMRMTPGMAFGTFDIPAGYFDWQKLGQAFGGGSTLGGPGGTMEVPRE